MILKSSVKTEKISRKKYFRKEFYRKSLGVNLPNFIKFKLKVLLGLTAGALLAYAYILSLFFQHTLSHLLIITLNSLHVVTCYQHYNILQFFYLLILVFLSDVTCESSDAGQDKKSTLHKKCATLRNYAKLASQRFLFYFLKTLKKSLIRMYESVKDIIMFLTSPDNPKDSLSPNESAIHFKLLQESLTNVMEVPDDEDLNTNNKAVTISCHEKGDSYDITRTADNEIDLLQIHECYDQTETFCQVHRKEKRDNDVLTDINLEPKSQLTYLVYYCKVIPTYNAVVGSNHNHRTKKSKHNKTTSFSKSIYKSIERPLYKRIGQGRFARWIDENDMPVKDFDIIASKLSVVSSGSDVNAEQDQWDSVKNNLKDLNTKAIKLMKSTKKIVVKKLPWLQTRTYVIYDAAPMSPAPPRPGKVSSNRPPPVSLASAQLEKWWFKTEYEKHIGAPPNAGSKKKSREGMIEDAVNSLRCCGRCQLVWERCCYRPSVPVKPLQPIEWQKAPLAIRCVCPKAACICKGNTLLPKTKIPFVFRHDYFGIHACLGCIGLYRPKPAKVLPGKLLKAVNEESNFYKSPEGRALLEERGPEFCMSGCVHFFASNKKMTKDLLQELKKMKQEMPPLPPPPPPQKPQSTKKARVKRTADNAFERTVGTQSNTNKDGEFVIGPYSHIVYPTFNEAFVTDTTGTMLRMTSYQYVPPPPFLDQIGFVKMKENMKQSISNTSKKIKYRAFGLGGDKVADKETQYDCNDMAGFEEVWGSYQDALRKFNENKWLSKGSSFKCCKYDKREVSHDVIPEDNESIEDQADFIRLPEYVVNEPPPNKLHSFVDSLIKRICEKKSIDKNMMGDLQDDSIYRPLTIGSNSKSSSSINRAPWELEAQGDQPSKELDIPSNVRPDLWPGPCCDKTIDDSKNDITDVSTEKISESLDDTTKAIKNDPSSSDNKGLVNKVSVLKVDNKPSGTLSLAKDNTQEQKEKVVMSAQTSTENAIWLVTPMDGNRSSKTDNDEKADKECTKTENLENRETNYKTNTLGESKPTDVVDSQTAPNKAHNADVQLLNIIDSHKSSEQQIQQVQENKEESHEESDTKTVNKPVSIEQVNSPQEAADNNELDSTVGASDTPKSAQTANVLMKTSTVNFIVEDKKCKEDNNIDAVQPCKSSCNEIKNATSSKSSSKGIVGQHNKPEEKCRTNANVDSGHSILNNEGSAVSKASKEAITSAEKIQINESKSALKSDTDKSDIKEKKSSLSSKTKKSPVTSFHVKEVVSIQDPKDDSPLIEMIENKPSKSSDKTENDIKKSSLIHENKGSAGSEIIKTNHGKGSEIIANVQSKGLVITENVQKQDSKVIERNKRSKVTQLIDNVHSKISEIIQNKHSKGSAKINTEQSKESEIIKNKRSIGSEKNDNELIKASEIIENKRSKGSDKIDDDHSKGTELIKDTQLVVNKRSKGSTESKLEARKQLVEKNLSAIYISLDTIPPSKPAKKRSSKFRAKISSIICNSKQKLKNKFSKESKVSNKSNSKAVVERGCDAFNNSSEDEPTPCSPSCKSECSENGKSMDSIRRYYRFYW